MWIARELHFVVAHNMSVTVVAAGAARRILDQDPREAARSIASVERTGREALNEMRRRLDVVRKSDQEHAVLAPQPGIGDIEPLIDKVRVAGIEVELVVDGSAGPLPQGLDLSADRLKESSASPAATTTPAPASHGRPVIHLVAKDRFFRRGCNECSPP